MDQTPIRATQHRLRVLRITDLTASMRRITLHAPTLAGLPLRPGQDVGLMLTGPDGRPVRRRYTIRNADSAAETIDLDGILHGHGPGATWFSKAGESAVVEAIGPRGKIEIVDTDWYLFVGDESGQPAFAELLAALPAGAVAITIIEVANAEEELPLPAGTGVTTWVHRNGTSPGAAEGLAAAIQAADLPGGTGQAYLLGESRAVVSLRAVLAGRGLIGPRVLLKGYWNSSSRR